MSLQVPPKRIRAVSRALSQQQATMLCICGHPQSIHGNGRGPNGIECFYTEGFKFCKCKAFREAKDKS
jgi:hypothetical protein